MTDAPTTAAPPINDGQISRRDHDLIATMLPILDEIMGERFRQLEKWGIQRHQPCEWIGVLGEEFGEASQAAVHLRFHPGKTTAEQLALVAHFREELVQIAAVAVAMIEQVDEEAWG